MSEHTVTVSAEHNEDVILFPISRGPYNGIDYLYIEDTWRLSRYNVRRHSLSGELIEDYGMFKKLEDAIEAVRKLRFEQGERDCSAVSGGGRWSCE